VFSHATPPHAHFAPPHSKQRPRCPCSIRRFIPSLGRRPSLFSTPTAKTDMARKAIDPNPIDSPASTAPAAHFKRLYRNCPQKGHPTDTWSRGSHDRVLTLCGTFSYSTLVSVRSQLCRWRRLAQIWLSTLELLIEVWFPRKSALLIRPEQLKGRKLVALIKPYRPRASLPTPEWVHQTKCAGVPFE
jgi:hypothetical protein